MTINLEYVEETTRKRLAFSAGELVPLGFVDLVAFHGKTARAHFESGGFKLRHRNSSICRSRIPRDRLYFLYSRPSRQNGLLR